MSTFTSSFVSRGMAALLVAGAAGLALGPSARADDAALGGITAEIPWSELRDLLRTAWEAEHPADGGPAAPAHAFGPAEVKATLGGGQLAATIEVPVRTFRDGATVVKLFDSAPAIGRALLDGATAPLLVGDGSLPELPGGALGLVVSTKGEHRLVMDLVVAAPEVPGPNAATLPPLPSPASTVELVVAADLSSVTVDGGVLLHGPGVAGTPAHTYRLALGGGMSLGVQYVAAAPPEDPVAPGEAATPRVTAIVSSMLEVGDGVLRLKSAIVFEITRAPITSIALDLPEGYELVRCEGTGLRRCAADDHGVLTAELGYKVDKAFSLEVVIERSATGEGTSKVAWPALKVRDVEHEIGFLGVVAESGIEVRSGELKGVLPLDVVELPHQLQAMSSRPALLGFRYTRHPYALALEITRHPSGEVLSSAVDQAQITLVATEDGDSVGRAVYRVRNNRKQFLVVALPKGSMIWNAFVAGEPVKPGESKPTEDGRPVYLVPLARSVGGAGGFAEAFDVEVIYFREGAAFGIAGSVVESIPSVDLPVSEMAVYLYLPKGHDYLSAGGDLDTPFGSESDFLSVDDMTVAMDRFADMRAPAAGEAAPARTDAPPAPADEAADKARALGTENIALDPIYRGAASGLMELAGRAGGDSGMARGVLPVKFVLPEHGVLVAFSTALVLPGESPSVFVRYGPSWVGTAAGALGAGAIMAAFVMLAGALMRARRQRKLSGADVQLWAAVATLFVASAIVYLAGGTLFPVVLAGLGLAVAYGLLRWLVERRGRLFRRGPADAGTATAAAAGAAGASATVSVTMPPDAGAPPAPPAAPAA